VRADAGEARLRFQAAGEVKKTIPKLRIVPPGVEIVGEPARPLDAIDACDPESGLGDLSPELVRMVEKRVHEVFGLPGRISMLTIREVAVDDGREVGVG
jgi:hypothetical protein